MSAGTAPALLLHGQPGSARDWERIQSALGDRVSTIAIDRPGWDGARAARDLEGNALAAIEALDAIGVQRATVVGHSFGGGVAAWLAARHPERVAALVLLAPSANAASLYTIDRVLATSVLGELASVVTLGTAGVVLSAAAVRRRIADGFELNDGYLRGSARRLLTRASWRAFTVEQRVLIRDLPVLDDELGRITAATTIVTGTRDLVVPMPALRRLARQIPGARLELVERAGHLLPMRHAPEVAGIIERVVAGTGPV